MTGARIALGTPAYMSPEQCRDAAAVDHRADIYSLGCTLYVLVTGRPPFEGTTAVELMTKHAYEPLVPPEHIVARVPKEVSAVIQRMMAKNADDRFQSMSEVIRTLEAWLGIQHAGTFCPHEEQISRLEGYVHQFNHAQTAVLRRRILTGFFAGVALTALMIAFFGKLVWAFGLIGLVVQAALAYFVLDGVARRGHLFARARQFVIGVVLGGLGGRRGEPRAVLHPARDAERVLDLGRVRTHRNRPGVRAALRPRPAGRGRTAASGRCMRAVAPPPPVAGAGRGGVAAVRREVRGPRLGSVLRGAVRVRGQARRAGRSAPRRCGRRAREVRVVARAADRGNGPHRERPPRGPRAETAPVDRAAQLLAAGVAPEAADNKAKAAADAMVQAAGQIREAEEQRARVGNANPVAALPVNVHQAVAAAEENPFAFVSNPKRDPFGRFVNLFVGPLVRAILAAVLFAACGLWVHQNGLISGELQAQATKAVQSEDFSVLQQAATRDLSKPTKPLVLAGVPPIATAWVDGWNVGAAGLLLLASLFFRGNVMSVFALLGCAVAAVGHQYGIRTVEPFRAEHVALMLGSVLALVGFRAGADPLRGNDECLSNDQGKIAEFFFRHWRGIRHFLGRLFRPARTSRIIFPAPIPPVPHPRGFHHAEVIRVRHRGGGVRSTVCVPGRSTGQEARCRTRQGEVEGRDRSAIRPDQPEGRGRDAEARRREGRRDGVRPRLRRRADRHHGRQGLQGEERASASTSTRSV